MFLFHHSVKCCLFLGLADSIDRITCSHEHQSLWLIWLLCFESIKNPLFKPNCFMCFCSKNCIWVRIALCPRWRLKSPVVVIQAERFMCFCSKNGWRLVDSKSTLDPLWFLLRRFVPVLFLFESQHDKTRQSDCAPSENSDQPGHPPSLIRVFAVRMKKAWVLSYSLRAQRSLWSDRADVQADLSLRWAHNHIIGFVMSRLILFGLVVFGSRCFVLNFAFWLVLVFISVLFSSWSIYLPCVCLVTLYEPPHDKTNKVSVRPAKTQIGLGIRPIWSESSMSTWRNIGSLATQWVYSEDSDQPGRAHTHFVGFVMSWLNYKLISFCLFLFLSWFGWAFICDTPWLFQ